MGKSKDKKVKRSRDAFLEMSPYSSYVHENGQQLALSSDTESSILGSPKRLDMLTSSSEKSKKKQKKDLAAQECENKSSESHTESEQEHGKNPTKKRKSRDGEIASNKPAELHLSDMVDGLAAQTSHRDEPARKKKKKHKRQIEETVMHDVSDCNVSRNKEKKKRSIHKVEEMNATLMSEENEMMSDETTGYLKKKKKKKKEKENHEEISESATSSAQSVQENGFNASAETREKQTEHIQVKKKKDKKKKDKGKKNENLIEILESEHLGKENGSIDQQKMDKVKKSTEPEESLTKRSKKKNEATRTNRGLKTRQTQTLPKMINPKTEPTDECSVNVQVENRPGFGKRNIRASKEVDQQLVEELKEFVPNIVSRGPADIMKSINYDLPRYREFKKMGIPLNHGMFTATENETLKKNVMNFLALTGIDSGTKLFYPAQFPEERDAIVKLKRIHRFFEAIAEGIPRSCHDIYGRGRKIFDNSTCRGKFTKSELHQLCKLQTLHGNDWKKISELTGRSALSLEKRYSHINIKVGPWSKKELQRLLRAVRDYIVSEVQPGSSNINSFRVSREMLCKGLPWRNISQKVKTRSWGKCRQKWLSVLANRMSSGAVYGGNGNDGRIKLIKAMYELQVEDVADVNWDQLSALFGNVPPLYVQKKWNRLKVSYVPNWQSKCFADIIDFLYEKLLPIFEAEMVDHADHDVVQLEQSQAKSFLFSDIFYDVSDQDTTDDDDDDDDGGGEVAKKGR